MKVKFDVKMNQKTMYNFLMHHTYHTPAGYFATAVGIGILALFFATLGKEDAGKSVVYGIFGFWFLVYLPVSLYLKAARQVKLNPVYQKPLTYLIDETGITTSQGEQQDHVDWDQLVKIRETRLSLLIYTGKTYCFVLPKEAMGSNCQAVKDLIRAKVKAGRVKIHGN